VGVFAQLAVERRVVISLTGQTVLVTGGSKGIERVICLYLTKRVNIVIAASIDSEMTETMDKLRGDENLISSIYA
jgi:NAD(P)-dependent dehydrogenase (short-subunit alcohol dehydrogenase family)